MSEINEPSARTSAKTVTKTVRSTKKTEEKDNLQILEKQVAALTKKCDLLEDRCTKLESQSKTAKPTTGSGELSDARWESLKLYLEKKFGKEMLKSTGVWEL